MTDREQLIAARLNEAEYLFVSARSHFNRADQVLAVGATALAAAIGVAAAHEEFSSELLIGLPPLLLLLMTYVLQTYADVVVMETARARIEEVLAQDLEQSPLIYQRWANRRERQVRSLSPAGLAVVVTLGLIGLMIAGGIAAWNAGGGWTEVAYAAGTALLLATALGAAVDFATAERVTRQNVQNWPARNPPRLDYDGMTRVHRRVARIMKGPPDDPPATPG